MRGRICSSLPAVAVLAAPLSSQAPVVNAPVAPEAVYLGLAGPTPGLSVIDLNGAGQGTGSLVRSRFPLNPNIGVPGVMPPLAPGTSALDAGGAGFLTLTEDSLGGTNLLPSAAGIHDLAIGMPLDLVFNNDNINAHAGGQHQVNPATGLPERGNTIAVAPHPNPPRLVQPPPNPARGIEAEEPTVTTSGFVPGRVTTTSPPCFASPLNLLGIGNPSSSSPSQFGLFGANFPGVFYGPQPPPLAGPLPACPYTCRQQVGHFLFACDRPANRVLVLNSNRGTVLNRIAVPDPTNLAMHPTLRLLAVTSAATDRVFLIDSDATSATFANVLAAIPVGRSPSGCAWQPEGEDLFVCNTGDSTVSIVGGATLTVRKTLRTDVTAPLDVAVTLRQVHGGRFTFTYHAYILNGDGTVAVFESGPAPIGPDDVLGIPPDAHFRRARALQADLATLDSACWVTHVDQGGLAQLSRLALSGGFGPSLVGPRGDQDAFFTRQWSVTARIGGIDPTTPVRDLFSGNVAADLAFDNTLNEGAFPDVRSLLLPAIPVAPHSGKGQAKLRPNGTVTAAHAPRLLFVALPDVAKVDVFELATGSKLGVVDAPGIRCLADYWRQ